MNSQDHWNSVYETKGPSEVSWTQLVPEISLNFIHSFKLPRTASIIDVGGGDSNLVDHLLAESYENITVLDISEKALDKARQRLGSSARKVTWITSNVLDFKPNATYAIWHDRATFHFLTHPAQIAAYLATARKAVTGYLTIGTFSDNGPDKCSGLSVKQYNERELQQELAKGFDKLRCITEDHTTPFDTIQNFLFCSFQRNNY